MVDGTSASTVFVTGAIALLLENSPELSSDNEQSNSDTVTQIKQLILNSVKARDGQEGHDDNYGYGLLQINDLLIASGSV